jgi:hypothetical protein
MDIIKNILAVAKALLGLTDQLRAADSQRRNSIADLFEHISDTLSQVSSEIRLGHVPHGKCSELITYADALPGTIAGQVGDQKADELGKTLHSGYNVELLAMQLEDKSDKEPYLQALEEASGKFRALAYLMRAA